MEASTAVQRAVLQHTAGHCRAPQRNVGVHGDPNNKTCCDSLRLECQQVPRALQAPMAQLKAHSRHQQGHCDKLCTLQYKESPKHARTKRRPE